MRTKERPWGLSEAVLIVQNVKVRMEPQHYILLLRLHDLLRESFTF